MAGQACGSDQDRKAPGWWAVGGRYAKAEKPGGSLSATPLTKFRPFRCLGRLWLDSRSQEADNRPARLR